MKSKRKMTYKQKKKELILINEKLESLVCLLYMWAYLSMQKLTYFKMCEKRKC